MEGLGKKNEEEVETEGKRIQDYIKSRPSFTVYIIKSTASVLQNVKKKKNWKIFFYLLIVCKISSESSSDGIFRENFFFFAFHQFGFDCWSSHERSKKKKKILGEKKILGKICNSFSCTNIWNCPKIISRCGRFRFPPHCKTEFSENPPGKIFFFFNLFKSIFFPRLCTPVFPTLWKISRKIPIPPPQFLDILIPFFSDS